MRGYCPDVMIHRKLAGNIVDRKTIRHLLSDLEFLGRSKIKRRIMDRGCHSEDTISTLFRDHVKFLVSAKMSLSLIRTELVVIYDTVRSFSTTRITKRSSQYSRNHAACQVNQSHE